MTITVAPADSANSPIDSLREREVVSNKEHFYLRAALYKYRLSSFGREKMKYLKLSQKNGLYK